MRFDVFHRLQLPRPRTEELAPFIVAAFGRKKNLGGRAQDKIEPLRHGEENQERRSAARVAG